MLAAMNTPGKLWRKDKFEPNLGNNNLARLCLQAKNKEEVGIELKDKGLGLVPSTEKQEQNLTHL